MNHVIVQIYEIQTPAEAEVMALLGVDHIGSVLVSEENWKNPQLRDTIETVRRIPAKSSLIPLFSKPDSVFRVLEYYQPHIVHFCETLFHPDTPLKSCQPLIDLQSMVKKRFSEIHIMRSIPIAQTGNSHQLPSLELARMFEPVSDWFLTDTFLIHHTQDAVASQPVSGFVGITGKTCDWDMAAQLVQCSRIPVILAGGISPENVFDSIRYVRPAGIDSCTGTNATDRDGRPIRFKKDPDKVRRLVQEVRRAERQLGYQDAQQS